MTHAAAGCLSVASRVTANSTGKERDAESGNDYFGARYYAPTMGRFLSPDPSIQSAELRDPQTWNRYAYVTNNPFKFYDPTGEARNPVTNKEGLNPATARSGYGRIRATASNAHIGEYGMVRSTLAETALATPS